MKRIQTLRKKVWNLWNKGQSIAAIEQILGVSIEIGGDISELPQQLYLGNFGIYTR